MITLGGGMQTAPPLLVAGRLGQSVLPSKAVLLQATHINAHPALVDIIPRTPRAAAASLRALGPWHARERLQGSLHGARAPGARRVG